MYPYSIMKGYTQLLKGTGGKKYKMVFYDMMRKKIKSVSFGDSNYEDFTQHGDIQRKMNYLQRHENNENWNDPMTAGSLSRFILWNLKSVSASYKNYRNKFKYELF
jgi:hypothetical protein